MKQMVWLFFLTMAALIAFAQAPSPCRADWTQLGAAIPDTGNPAPSYLIAYPPSMIVVKHNGNDVPHIAFTRPTTTQAILVVNWTGSSWAQVGGR